MSLLDRLRGIENPRINAHGFQAAMSEWADSAPGFSRATIIAEFGLETDDEAELDAIRAIWVTANTNSEKLAIRKAFDNVVLLLGDRDVTFYKIKADILARLTTAAGG